MCCRFSKQKQLASISDSSVKSTRAIKQSIATGHTDEFISDRNENNVAESISLYFNTGLSAEKYTTRI